MKVIVKASMIILVLLFPVSIMAMTPVMDADLADVTAQAGVSINADLRMNINIGTMAWGDSDGVLTAFDSTTMTGSGGYVGVTNFNITNLRIKARETDTFNGYIPYYDSDTSDSTNAAVSNLKPITIDVASDSTYVIHNGATFVRIGLGSLEISMDAMSMSVELGPTTALGEQLGTCNIGPLALYINPLSYVDIYNSRPGNRTGINLSMYMVIDQFDVDYMSWGDMDGQANDSGVMPWMSTGLQSAGFIGLENLNVGGPITMTGTVMIDVTTSAGGIYSHGFPWTVGGAYAPVSVVHIGFPSLFNLNVAGPITADVRIANNAALDDSLAGNFAGTLGNIYLSAVNLDIRSGSWVDIWAH